MATKIICATVAAALAIGTTAQAGGLNTAGTSGLTKTTTITHPGNFAQNTTTFTNQNGKVVTAISSISSISNNPTPTSVPPGTLAPKGMIVSRTPSGAISSVKMIGGYAPGAGTPPSNVLTFPHGGTGASLPSLGGSGIAHNTTNGQNSPQVQNGTNAVQSHNGVNCNAWLHRNKFC
jgi:hypothetical protein